jgi:hypothetical protein
VSETPADIERIIREVLSQLGVGGAASSNGQPTAVAKEPPPAHDVSRFVIPERLVTLATLEGRLNGAKVVAVRRGAVITPAVRDELKSRNIRLEFHNEEGAKPAAAAKTRLIVGIGDTDLDVRTALDAVSAHVAGQAQVQSVQSADLAILVRRVKDEFAVQPSLGVVLSVRPVAAAGLANRQPGLRAAWACHPRAVAEAVRTFAANVIAYNPASHSKFEQRNMLQAFVQGGVLPCPPEFADA